MLNIGHKLFGNELPAHHLLRFTQGCEINQNFIIRKLVYFIDKYNSVGLLEASHYCEKLLLSRSVVTLWIV